MNYRVKFVIFILVKDYTLIVFNNSFAVGGDGKVYEGRGWSREGAHAPKYNRKSIGICTIGDWRSMLKKNQPKSFR